MGRADVQNLAARWRRWTLVSGGGKSMDEVLLLSLLFDTDSLVSFCGVVDDARITECVHRLELDGEMNARVIVAVNAK
eukprot:scaffold15231_cov66-Cyclotella_meneghiniana.AAC.15